MMNLKNLPRYWKAVMGFVAPAASVIVISVTSGSDGGSVITKAEWITAVAAAIVTAAAVGAVKNQPAPPSNNEKV